MENANAGDNDAVARRPRSMSRSRRARHGLVDSLIDWASDIVGAVAKDVAPDVVGVLDVNGVVQEIDFNALLDRIDFDALLARMDMNALVASIDLDAALEHVDLDALLARTEIGSLLARSGAGVAGKVLDVARSQGVTLDEFVHRWVNRVLRRRHGSMQATGPPRLVGMTSAQPT